MIQAEKVDSERIEREITRVTATVWLLLRRKIHQRVSEVVVERNRSLNKTEDLDPMPGTSIVYGMLKQLERKSDDFCFRPVISCPSSITLVLGHTRRLYFLKSMIRAIWRSLLRTTVGLIEVNKLTVASGSVGSVLAVGSIFVVSVIDGVGRIPEGAFGSKPAPITGAVGSKISLS
jgi:hypothetical protein